jgi:ketol-acid reductoisomerase
MPKRRGERRRKKRQQGKGVLCWYRLEQDKIWQGADRSLSSAGASNAMLMLLVSGIWIQLK